MSQNQTKRLVGLGVNQQKTAIGFLMKQMESKCVVYLKIVLILTKKTTHNIFQGTKIVNISTVCLLRNFST